MRTLTLTALIITGFCACDKPESPEPGPTPQPLITNTTEASMLGTWYLKKEHYKDDTRDTTYAVFTGTPYVKFTENEYPTDQNVTLENAKKYTDNASILLPTVGIFSGHMRGSSTQELYWAFDSISNQLTVYNVGYKIVLLDETHMNICPVVLGTKDTLFFEK